MSTNTILTPSDAREQADKLSSSRYNLREGWLLAKIFAVASLIAIVYFTLSFKSRTYPENIEWIKAGAIAIPGWISISVLCFWANCRDIEKIQKVRRTFREHLKEALSHKD